MCISYEIRVRGLVDQPYRFGLALRRQNLGLLDPFGFLDLRPSRSTASAKSKAATFSFSALTTLFMVSWTSLGGSISFNSVRTISIPQCLVSLASVSSSAVLILSRSLLADFSVSVPMILRRVVRARLTI